MVQGIRDPQMSSFSQLSVKTIVVDPQHKGCLRMHQPMEFVHRQAVDPGQYIYGTTACMYIYTFGDLEDYMQLQQQQQHSIQSQQNRSEPPL